MTWIAVTDPNSEESTTPPPLTPTTSDAYQQVAAHTLEALSTAAADHVSYPLQATVYYTVAQTESHPEYRFVRADGTGVGPQTGNINFLLNPSQGQTPASLIDPTLESSVGFVVEQATETKAAENPTDKADVKTQLEEHDDQEQEEAMADSDSRVAMALRSFNETPV